MMDLLRIISLAAEKKASDLHLTVGLPPCSAWMAFCSGRSMRL